MNTADHQPPMPSNARFGGLFALIFAAVAIYKFWKGQPALGGMAAVVAAAFTMVIIIRPAVLQPLNKLWLTFGLLLGRVVSPLVLAFLFFLVITPVALVGAAFGRDPLRMKRHATVSYWIKRAPVGPAPDSFKHQF
jgi:hypothetical protein